MRRHDVVKKRFRKKLIRQVLFSDNMFAQISALVLLAKYNDPEAGWLLETLVENQLIFKISKK